MILFLFRTVHQADQFVISAVLPQIIEEFQMDYVIAGALFTATNILAIAFYPIWGYLLDRYSRRLLISLMGMLWGLTTWLSTLPRTLTGFFIARTLTGVDNAPPAGIYSLLSDYFHPKKRGKPFGLISAAGAFGALIGTIVGVAVGYAYGWRQLFFLTGALGILMALFVYFFVRDIPRGSAEPELSGLELREELYRIKIKDWLTLIKRTSLRFLYLQGFFGAIPWYALGAWTVSYLIIERGFNEFEVMLTMTLWLVVMVLGNFMGGALGDFLFARNMSGRAIIGAVTVFLSAFAMYIVITWPREDIVGFIIAGSIACLIFPMAGPNVSASITDVTEPEMRSSAGSLAGIFEAAASSTAPLIVGFLANLYGIGLGILYVSVSTWLACGIFFTILVFVIRKDIMHLRSRMGERAELLKKLH